MGHLSVILGCMFAQKTTELLRRIRQFKAIGYNVLVINYAGDTRYGTDKIVSHNTDFYDALCVKALATGGLVDEHDIKKLADKGDNETAVTKGIKRALDGMFKRGLVKKVGYGVWQRIA